MASRVGDTVRRSGFRSLATALAIVLVTWEGTTPSVWSQTQRVASPSPIITFSRYGGFPPGGPYRVRILSDGHVKLRHQVGSVVRLLNPYLVLSSDAIGGLMKLIQVEGFYALPETIPGSSKILDLPTFKIQVRTASGAKSVTDARAHNSAFAAIYDVLLDVTGVCIGSPNPPDACARNQI